MNHKILQASGVAGNAATDFLVPTNLMYKVLHGHCIVVSGVGANARRLLLEVLDENSNIIIDSHAGATQAALSMKQYAFKQGIYRETSFIDNDIEVPLASDLYVPGGYTIRFTLEDGYAVDAYDINLAVEVRAQSAF